jgi:type II secretory pathway predicted ATPase ExeA
MTDCTKFYGFSENPFGILPVPKFYFPSESHREALASLQYGIEYRKGFILVLGEAGTGKTLLIQHLIATSDQQSRIIYFPQSDIPFHEMLKQMLLHLNLPLGMETKGSMMHSLYDHLIQGLKRDEKVILIIDEAENIKLDMIEEVRLLANLETGKSKLLQIVLVGRPELKKKLSSDIVRQIKQRIVISCWIRPMSQEESARFIDHRLKLAGSGSSKVFTDEALSLVCHCAKGSPLALNTLCSNALSVGCELAEKRVSASTIRKVRRGDGILAAQKARTLAAAIKTRPRKIILTLLLIVLAATAVFWGGIYVQQDFKTYRPNQSVVAPTPGKPDAAPVVRTPAAVLQVPISSAPRVAETVQDLPRMPALPSAMLDKAQPDIRIKKIIQARQGVNLSSLAFEHYKMADETLVDHILKLNPEITNPNLILVDQKIRIPEMTESLLIVRSPEGLYKIHLRTFTEQKSAERYGRAVSTWAQDITIVSWKISTGETWYRVMAGPYIGRQEALSAIGEIKQKGFSIIPSKEERSLYKSRNDKRYQSGRK